ncbi:MAG TPA: YfhO family protein [Roseimicrobium sp.]|nr:YfhO family protein [Roseimicrobium sp.]
MQPPEVSASEPLSAKTADSQFTPGRLMVWIGVVLFVLHPEIFLGSHTFFHRDFGCFTYPAASLYRESLLNGEFPLWNPWNNCGVPFLAQWNTVALYPGSLIYLLPMPWSVGLFELLHLVLAGWGMYRLALRWTGTRFGATVAGFAFAVNGLTLNCLMWASNLPALAFIPWIIDEIDRCWTADPGQRPRVVRVAIVLSLQWLTGAPEIFLMTAGLAFALGVYRFMQARRSGGLLHFRNQSIHLFLAGLVAIGITAAQWLPFLELLQHSSRESGQFKDQWAMASWGWMSFVAPLVHTSTSASGVASQAAQQWTSSYYAGIGVLALALARLNRKRDFAMFLAAIALCSVLLAIGGPAGLLALLRTILPPVDLIRYPVKFVSLAVFLLPILAAFTLADLSRASFDRLQQFRRRWWQVVVVLMLVGLAAVWSSYTRPIPNEQPDSVLTGTAARQMIAIVAGFVLLRAFASKAVLHQLLWRMLFLLLLGIDIVTHMPRQNPTVVTLAMEPGAAHLNLRPDATHRAMITPTLHKFMDQAGNPDALNYCIGNRRVAFANWNVLDHLPKINGFYSLYVRRQHDIVNLIYEGKESPERLLDFLGVSQKTSETLLFNWDARTNALPIVTAGQSVEFTDDEATLRALKNDSWNPAATVYLLRENGDRVTVPHTNASVQVENVDMKAHSLHATFTASAPSITVFAVTHYPAWQATVNGSPAPILRANHAFMAVPIPVGKSTVSLDYVDRTFQKGLRISAFSLFLMVFMAWAFSRAKQNPA